MLPSSSKYLLGTPREGLDITLVGLQERLTIVEITRSSIGSTAISRLW